MVGCARRAHAENASAPRRIRRSDPARDRADPASRRRGANQAVSSVVQTACLFASALLLLAEVAHGSSWRLVSPMPSARSKCTTPPPTPGPNARRSRRRARPWAPISAPTAASTSWAEPRRTCTRSRWTWSRSTTPRRTPGRPDHRSSIRAAATRWSRRRTARSMRSGASSRRARRGSATSCSARRSIRSSARRWRCWTRARLGRQVSSGAAGLIESCWPPSELRICKCHSGVRTARARSRGGSYRHCAIAGRSARRLITRMPARTRLHAEKGGKAMETKIRVRIFSIQDGRQLERQPLLGTCASSRGSTREAPNDPSGSLANRVRAVNLRSARLLLSR